MAKSIYVGNLNYSTTEEALRKLFAAHGEVASVNVIVDRQTGRARGFAFVEMATDAAAAAAIAALNGATLDGRELRVAEARPQQQGGRRDTHRDRDRDFRSRDRGPRRRE